MVLKAPSQLPFNFLHSFGYHGYKGWRRLVGLFWEPCGDEACYDDGQSYACGCCNNWLFLDFVRRPDVRQWLDSNDINLGSSDEGARHWLIVDSYSWDVYVADHNEARLILLRQGLPDLPSGN